MQRILNEAEGNQQSQEPAAVQVAADAIRDILAGMNLGSQGAASGQPTPPAPDVIARLTLRHSHIFEDAENFQKQFLEVKLATEMTDSEVIYFMRESKNWSKQINDLVSSNRKFQEEALGKPDIKDMAAELDDNINVKKKPYNSLQCNIKYLFNSST